MTACFIDSGLEHGNFLNTDISQNSVVTQLRCAGIVNEDFIANLLVNLSMKEFWKSVNIWWSYGQYYSGCLLLTHSVVCIYRSIYFNYTAHVHRVLASEIQHKGHSVPFVGSRSVNQGRISLVSEWITVSAWSSDWCFDTSGWLTGRASGMQISRALVILESSVLETRLDRE